MHEQGSVICSQLQSISIEIELRVQGVLTIGYRDNKTESIFVGVKTKYM